MKAMRHRAKKPNGPAKVGKFLMFDTEPWRGHEGTLFHPVKFRMVGPYNVWASHARLTVATGCVHAIKWAEHGMTQCGKDTSLRPMNLITVKDAMLTCRQCITFIISDLLRVGLLPSVCGGQTT